MTSEEFDKLLLEADATRNVGVLSTVMMDMLRRDPNLTFADFERRFRELGRPTFLLAAPPEEVPLTCQARDVRTNEPAPSHIYVCLYGEREAEEMRVRFGIPDAEQNLKMLERCGVLILKLARVTGL